VANGQRAGNFALAGGQQIERRQAPEGQTAQAHALKTGSGFDLHGQILIGQGVGAGGCDQRHQSFGQAVACPAGPDIAKAVAQGLQAQKGHARFGDKDRVGIGLCGAAGFGGRQPHRGGS